MSVVLELSEAGVATRGVELWRSLSMRSQFGRLGLVGDWSPLFALLARRAALSSGRATLDGTSLELAVAQRAVGLALCDPPLAPKLRVVEQLTAAAELSGLSRRAARNEARAALVRLGLESLEKRKLRSLTRLEERALGCALAIVAEPRTVCVETPFAGLDAVSADHLAGLLDRVGERHALCFSLDEMQSLGPERSALDRCDQILILNGETVTRLDPEHDRPVSYRLSVTGNVTELRAALERLGCELSVERNPIRNDASFILRMPPELDASQLFERARAAGATLLELEGL